MEGTSKKLKGSEKAKLATKIAKVNPGRSLLMTEEELQAKAKAKQEKANVDLEQKLESLEETGVTTTKTNRKPWSKEARKALSITIKQFYVDHPEKKAELSEKLKIAWDDQELRDRQAVTMKRVLKKGSPGWKAMMAGIERAKGEREAKKAEEK